MCKIGHATVSSTVWEISVFHLQTGCEMEVGLAMYIVQPTPSSENEVNMRIKAKTIVALSRRGRTYLICTHIY